MRSIVMAGIDLSAEEGAKTKLPTRECLVWADGISAKGMICEVSGQQSRTLHSYRLADGSRFYGVVMLQLDGNERIPLKREQSLRRLRVDIEAAVLKNAGEAGLPKTLVHQRTVSEREVVEFMPIWLKAWWYTATGLRQLTNIVRQAWRREPASQPGP